MRWTFACWLLALVVALPGSSFAAEELPKEAKDLLVTYEQDLVVIQKKAEEEAKARRAKLAQSLEELQVKHTKAGELDQALAIRDLVRALKAGAYGTQKAPLNMLDYRDQVGKVFYFETVGGTSPSVYGTDIYTDDSLLSTAAVHAGVLKNGQKGVIKVTVLPGQASYTSSSRNGVTTSGWFGYGGSYKVEALDGKPKEDPNAKQP